MEKVDVIELTEIPANRVSPPTDGNRPVTHAILGFAAVMAFCAVFAVDAAAQCALPTRTRAIVSSELKSVLQQKSAETPATSVAQTFGTPSIVGLWQVSFLYDGEVFDEAFDAWHSDGNEVLNDYTNPIEGNVCLGVWEQTGKNTFKLKHPSWTFDSGGNLTGTAIIRETVIVNAGAQSYSGPVTVDVYDLSGNLTATYSEQVEAKRITPN
jgi:hypothetical protein